MLTAAWLGQGTVHLLVRRGRLAITLTGILAALSVLAAIMVLSSPLSTAAANYRVAQPISSQYQNILTRNGLTVFLTILLNIYGTLTLVGGAIYSVVIFLRKHVMVHRMIGNIFIAVGAIAPAMAGSFVRLGLPDLLYLAELVGAILMYIGFLEATTSRRWGEGADAGRPASQMTGWATTLRLFSSRPSCMGGNFRIWLQNVQAAGYHLISGL